MTQLIVLILLLLVSHITTTPVGVIDASFSALGNLTNPDQHTTLSNSTIIFKNTTSGDERVKQTITGSTMILKNAGGPYSTFHLSVPSAQSIVKPTPTTGDTDFTDCATICESQHTSMHRRGFTLIFSINCPRKLSGNGQDPNVWCDNFKARMMYDCGVGKPDFFDCNTGRAPVLPGLSTWTYDGDTVRGGNLETRSMIVLDQPFARQLALERFSQTG
ncbi:hypothetical protein K449DRAFT_428816 [Hypoxylon sp. EC38]|nr:hypothetical protein K449DRAFT_428816 [Hypoxylon sp. EC38]